MSMNLCKCVRMCEFAMCMCGIVFCVCDVLYDLCVSVCGYVRVDLCLCVCNAGTSARTKPNRTKPNHGTNETIVAIALSADTTQTPKSASPSTITRRQNSFRSTRCPSRRASCCCWWRRDSCLNRCSCCRRPASIAGGHGCRWEQKTSQSRTRRRPA